MHSYYMSILSKRLTFLSTFGGATYFFSSFVWIALLQITEDNARFSTVRCKHSSAQKACRCAHHAHRRASSITHWHHTRTRRYTKLSRH